MNTRRDAGFRPLYPRQKDNMTSAFDSFDLAGIPLNNRIVMAPMTRSRACADGQLATDLMATYYAQRAGAGLIITEGTQPSVVGQGFPNTPGLHSPEQVTAWRRVTDAVHARGGTIFVQLMHAGRIGDPDLLPGELIPVAPSAVRAHGDIYTHAGPKPYVTPHALTAAEIAATTADYAQAARNAIAAGFDGVEIHGGYGYLIHQFLAPNTNLRTDEWGGSLAGQTRFAVEVAQAVAAAIGAERTGIRLTPGAPMGDIAEPEPDETYATLVAALAPLGLAYLHVVEQPGQRGLINRLRAHWPGAFILNPDSTPAATGPEALALIENGTTDLVSFGYLALANPDFVDRLATDGPFNEPDHATAFGGDHLGYTDYPALP